SAATASPAPVSANLNVPLLALKTPNRPGVRLAWVFGTVTDRLNRPAAAGLRIVATLSSPAGPGSACLGTGTTQDVYWTPKTPGAQPVNVKGFYLIGIEIAKECQDTRVMFELSGAGGGSQGDITPAPLEVTSPPYGRPYHRNLVLTGQ